MRAFSRSWHREGVLFTLTANPIGATSKRCIPGFLLVVLLAEPAIAVTYRLTDLGELPDRENSSTANAVNNAGQVVGMSKNSSGQRAFLWDLVTGMLLRFAAQLHAARRQSQSANERTAEDQKFIQTHSVITRLILPPDAWFAILKSLRFQWPWRANSS